MLVYSSLSYTLTFEHLRQAAINFSSALLISFVSSQNVILLFASVPVIVYLIICTFPFLMLGTGLSSCSLCTCLLDNYCEARVLKFLNPFLVYLFYTDYKTIFLNNCHSFHLFLSFYVLIYFFFLEVKPFGLTSLCSFTFYTNLF